MLSTSSPVAQSRHHRSQGCKKAFDELGIKRLQVEFAEKLKEKKEAYAEFKKFMPDCVTSLSEIHVRIRARS